MERTCSRHQRSRQRAHGDWQCADLRRHGTSAALVLAGADPDGDPLFPTVHFSADDGANWQVVELLTGQNSVALDTRKLPGGAACRLRVIVTDGFRSGVAKSSAFVLPTHAPQITIIGAVPGEKSPFGTQAALTAFALDAEEGSLAGSSISWTLVGPEPRAKSGDTLSLAGLPPGTYTATASTTDLYRRCRCPADHIRGAARSPFPPRRAEPRWRGGAIPVISRRPWCSGRGGPAQDSQRASSAPTGGFTLASASCPIARQEFEADRRRPR